MRDFTPRFAHNLAFPLALDSLKLAYGYCWPRRFHISAAAHWLNRELSLQTDATSTVYTDNARQSAQWHLVELLR